MKPTSDKGSKNPYDRPERLEFCREQRKKHPVIPEIDYSVHIPSWVSVGYGCTIHAGVKFTEGFGYARTEEGGWLHIPHIGKIILGEYVDIYPYTTINRGTVYTTRIGQGTKIDHHCHIGHNSKIGMNCIICAGVIIAGSVEIGDNVWIGPGSKIINKAKIANDCYIGQGANVVTSMLQEHCVIVGNPARSKYRQYLPHIKVG